MTEDKDTLLVTPLSKTRVRKELTINADQWDKLLRRLLVQAYHQGYETIFVNYSKPATIATIQSITPELVGLEIVEHDAHKCVLRQIAQPYEVDHYQKLVQRSFLLVRSTITDFCTALETKDRDLFEGIRLRDKDINKLTYFCMRQSRQLREHDRSYLVLYLLERIADEYRELAEYCLQHNLKPSPRTTALFGKVRDFFDSCYSFTVHKTRGTALEIAQLNDSLRAEVKYALRSENAEVIKPLFLLRSVINMMLSIQEVQLLESSDLANT